MILPTSERCKEVIAALQNEPALSDWEREFVKSNRDRNHFSDYQKQVIAKLIEAFEV